MSLTKEQEKNRKDSHFLDIVTERNARVGNYGETYFDNIDEEDDIADIEVECNRRKGLERKVNDYKGKLINEQEYDRFNQSEESI